MEYLVIGETLPPEHFEAPSFKTTLENAISYQFSVGISNNNRLEAENKHLERLRISGRVEERQKILQEQQEVIDYEYFTVFCDSEYVSIPPVFQLQCQRSLGVVPTQNT